MQSNCIRDASKACLNTCCLGDQPHSSSPPKPLVDPRLDFVSSITSSIQPNSTFSNHESLPSLTELSTCLQNALPSYSNTLLADHIRDQEYYHLSKSNHVCLDYIGHGLFSYSQKQDTENIASSSVADHDGYGPFFDISYTSVNLYSYLQYGTQESEFQVRMRKRIMRFMNVFEDDYSLVFTANQSSAFKILADSYPFQSNQNLLTVYDHDSEAVQMLIESAKRRGSRPRSAVFSWSNFRVNSRKLRKLVMNKSKVKNKGLFVFPLQSRMTGSRYSYQWMNLARDNGWHVLLDASALGAKEMETLGLSLFQPDLLICSFFKIFGQNPSGLCCLFIKKSCVQDLSQSSTSMGIVSIDETPKQEPEPSVSEIEEHDTGKNSGQEFRGLDHADKLGLILISNRMRCLVNWLVNALLSLQHPNSVTGLPLIVIYGPRIKLDRGSAIAFNVYDWKGEKIEPVLVQKLADRNNISLTCGFLKNIWFSEKFQEEKEIVLEYRSGSGSERKWKGKGKGKEKEKEGCGIEVVSVSVGMLSNFEDMYRVWSFVSRFLDADFVEKEKWRYTALNQTTIEV